MTNLEDTQSGFQKAALFYMTFPDGVPVVNVKIPDGPLVRLEVSRGQLSSVVAESIEHVLVRV